MLRGPGEHGASMMPTKPHYRGVQPLVPHSADQGTGRRVERLGKVTQPVGAGAELLARAEVAGRGLLASSSLLSPSPTYGSGNRGSKVSCDWARVKEVWAEPRSPILV